EACNHCCLGEREILDLLIEVEIGSGGDAEGAAAEIGAVEIELKDFLLAEIGLKPCGEEGFLDLALDCALICEEQVFGQLLRDRRAALDDRVRTHVFRQCAGEPDEIDSEMLEEAPVLGCENGLDDMIRHLVDRHGIALANAALADLV